MNLIEINKYEIIPKDWFKDWESKLIKGLISKCQDGYQK